MTMRLAANENTNFFYMFRDNFSSLYSLTPVINIQHEFILVFFCLEPVRCLWNYNNATALGTNQL